MSYPVLYGPGGETADLIGRLTDASSCTVIQELNGRVELELQYPVDGVHVGEIAEGCILMCKPDRLTDLQPFRIYRTTTPLQGLITVYAHHLIYDLTGIPVSPFSADSVSAALQGFRSHALIPCPFTFSTDLTTQATFRVAAPAGIFALMGGQAGSILDVYGGEYSYNGRAVTLLSHRGADRGAVISYGKNLLSSERDRSTEAVYSGVVAYWAQEETVITGSVVAVPGTFAVARVLPLDCSQDFETQPTTAQLDAAASNYISANSLAVPATGWKIEFALLSQSPEYKEMALMEDVGLGDTVTVRFRTPEANVSARAVETRWNVLRDRYDSVTLGRVAANLAQTIATQAQEISAKPSRSWTLTIAAQLARIAMGEHAGAVRLLDTNNDGQPDELYIADHEDPAQAVKVIRANYEGIAVSSSGYNGPFRAGIGIDGTIAGWMVTAASIVAGYVRSASGDMELNLDAGTLLTVASKTYAASGYSSSDLDRILGIINGTITPTTADYSKYDFYNDGEITLTDRVVCQSIINTGEDLTITWRVSINPGETGACLKVMRTSSGARTGTVTTFAAGAGAVKAQTLSVADNAKVGGFATFLSGISVAMGVTVGGKNVVVENRIGTFVHGTISGESYQNGMFIPLGVSGNFQLGVGSLFIGFSITNKGVVSGSGVTGTPVYNYSGLG